MATLSPPGIKMSISAGTNNSARVPYTLKGQSDHNRAYNLVLAKTPRTFRLPNGSVLERTNISLDGLTDVDWNVVVEYGIYQVEGMDEFSVDFSISTENQRITQAIETISTYTASGLPAVDYKNVLGVTKDGVEGIDIPVPKFSFNHNWTLPDQLVSDDWVHGLEDIVGHTNENQFGRFAPGTVLQAGVSGSKRGRSDWALAANFVSSRNVTGIMIGDIGPIAKGGWEHVEVRYEDAADEENLAVYKRPRQVDVTRVFYSAPFEYLKIPPRRA